MRMHKESELSKIFTLGNISHGALYRSLSRDDRLFVKSRVEQYPKEIQTCLLEEYRKFNSLFEANTWLRETTDSFKKLIPDFVYHHFDAGEKELRDLGIKYSEHCRYIERVARSKTSKCGEVSTKVLEKITDYVKQKGVVPAIPDSYRTIEGCTARMQSQGWWLRKLRSAQKVALETIMIHLNRVNRVKGIYCSDMTAINRKYQKLKQLEQLERIKVMNEEGDSFSLKELYEKNVSNPVNRRNELMTRISGFEQSSKELGHNGLFITITCPSRFHNAYSKSGHRNPKWQGATPYDAQQYLCSVWARIRAELDRQAIRTYGIRIAEPQQDGTPHWHLLLFLKPDHVDSLKSIVSHYALMDDPDEKGAKENRVDFKNIDPEKGSAAGYVAKYVCKNIDGANLDEGVYGEDPLVAAQRVEAWASCWGIRQFQQIGGASVTVWRELRRLKNVVKNDSELKELFEAADTGDWAEYVSLMGGVFCKRKEQAVRPHYDIEICRDTGLIKSSWFDGLPTIKLKGIVHKGKEIITRIHKWKLVFQSTCQSPAFIS